MADFCCTDFYLSKNIPDKFNQEVFHKGLSPFMSLWKKLNHGHDFIRMTNELIETNNSAVEVFIKEEFYNALNLLQTIHKCFATLNRICKGLVIPDEKDVVVGTSLLNYETPKLWLDSWNGPKEPIQFLRTIVNKTIGLSKWKNENAENLLQKPLNLSTLFYPEAFLASHKQDFSRSNKCSIDELSLQTSWMSSANTSITLTGILIEGALFDNRTLKACTPSSENINNVPNCYLKWIQKNQLLEDDHNISIPLYSTSNREKKIVLLQVSCDKKDRDKWIQSGLAFYLEY